MRNVTCHVTKRDTRRDMSRVTVHVSHTTTTTPHYTLYVVTTVGGVCGSGIHPSTATYGLTASPTTALTAETAHTTAATMDGRCAASFEGRR